ncbi:alanine dehydrogenase [Frigoribacterium faeni]|uniref:Alanine dehydrogenase n=2 Tax=Frigoribacterium faeni TaxID=145483 RepID=A0A7W3JKD3_9MICO|nr:alanine dehydrogenase [Frigoribacterium faeni]BFF15986.1 alanine dehydrogenase [Microbacterium flavescens]GEK84293.1 alanine dehydrogenase [Frigoribacterium faeni]
MIASIVSTISDDRPREGPDPTGDPMRVGVPTEIKNNENRVAITPAGVDALVRRGHEVLVESGAGVGSRILDADYLAAGATIVATAAEVWSGADLLLKVKEPIAAEHPLLREGQVLFTYLHLAADRELTEALVASGTTAVAYETVQLPDRSLPLLQPMSEVAGRLSITVGAYQLMRASGGRGTLLGGVPGTPRAKVVVIGGGVAGEHAAANALGLGADVTVIDLSLPRLRALEARFDGRIQTRPSTPLEIAAQVREADLVIGSVLIPGAAAPKLVTDEMVASMKSGAVLVDIAIDQGGCFEGSHPTTHDDPTFAVHDAVYYCVANMPGAVPETSTRALTNATLPYVVALADRGWRAATAADPALAAGVNVHAGAVTNAGVAAALGMPLASLEPLGA